MQISNETIQLLKNFAAINSNILIRKGKTLSTISTAKNIFAKATVAEDFPVEVPVYDLNSLLALLTLMENQDVEFGEKSLTISKNDGKFEEYLIVIANGDVVVRMEPNFYDYKFKPFVACPNYSRETEFYGIPELLAVRSLIKEANTLRNARLDNINLSVNPMWIADRAAGIKSEPHAMAGKACRYFGVE